MNIDHAILCHDQVFVFPSVAEAGRQRPLLIQGKICMTKSACIYAFLADNGQSGELDQLAQTVAAEYARSLSSEGEQEAAEKVIQEAQELLNQIKAQGKGECSQ